MNKYCLINQKLLPENQAKISINERGFLFGDGIFETCKIFAGKIYDYEAHENRIKAGLKVLKFSAKIDDLKNDSLKLIKKNKIENGILRISISRGIGSLGYLPSQISKPLTVIQTFATRILPAKISLGVSSIKKPNSNSFPIFCKTTNALPSILTKLEAKEKNLFDSIIISNKNFICETSSANIFWVKNNKIYTPSKSCGLLPGTIRKKLLKISPIKIKEVKAKLNILKNADEIFLTNSSALIITVDELHWNKKIKKLQKTWGNKLLKLMEEDVEKSCKK